VLQYVCHGRDEMIDPTGYLSLSGRRQCHRSSCKRISRLTSHISLHPLSNESQVGLNCIQEATKQATRRRGLIAPDAHHHQACRNCVTNGSMRVLQYLLSSYSRSSATVLVHCELIAYPFREKILDSHTQRPGINEY
jgi:hypothetical protein